MVAARYRDQQRAGPGRRRILSRRPAQNCALPKALCGEQPQEKERSFPLCDVDVDFLHKPSREKSAERETLSSRGCQGGVAKAVWEEGVTRCVIRGSRD